MSRFYHADIYDRDRSTSSYWQTTVPSNRLTVNPLYGLQTCDVAIIGGGLTGLSTAYHLAKDFGIQACVLEASTIAWGASGRNGGFCCVGATRLSHDRLLQRFGQQEVRRFFQDQREGVELVRAIAMQEGIEIDAQGDGELQVAHHPSRWRELANDYAFFTRMAGYACQLWNSNELMDYGAASPKAFGGLWVEVGFGLNPLKYSLGLAQAVIKHGALLYAHSPVIQWEKQGNRHLLHTPQGQVIAKQVVVASNGYTEEALHRGFRDRLLPALSNIITTRPLTSYELEAQGWRTETPVFDTRNLLFYFRLLNDGRFLFGSRGGTVGSPEENQYRQQAMIRSFQTFFPAWKEVEITHFWHGLVCLSANLTPHIGQLSDDPTVFYSLAYHGNGVATSSWMGREVARLIAAQQSINNLCAVVRQPMRPFPIAALRQWYLRFAYTIYRVKDALP